VSGGDTGKHMKGGSVTSQGIHEGGQSIGFLSMAAVKFYCTLLSAHYIYKSIKIRHGILKLG
jgi:hypothetical protein